MSHKKVLVCGGSKGLGLSCVNTFLSAGYEVIVFSRSHGNLKLGGKLHFFKTDFQDIVSIQKSISKISSFNISVLINNSGGPESKSFLDTSIDDMLKGMQSHLLASHLITQSIVPKMIEMNFGRIINIISVTANNPLPNMIVSNSIRGAMVNWSKTLSKELASSNITVNNLLPGYTKTQRLAEVVESAARAKKISSDEIYANLIEQIPAKRFGDPSELASLALFIASDNSNYINGQSISVDGGWTSCI